MYETAMIFLQKVGLKYIGMQENFYTFEYTSEQAVQKHAQN